MKTLILGTASNIYDDEKAARNLFKPDIVIAVNHMGIHHAGLIDHWASCHVELFPEWLKARADDGHDEVGQLWTAQSNMPHLTTELKALGVKGAPYSETSSGGLAVEVALQLGAGKIILAGLPLQNGGHYYGDENAFMEEAHYRRGWLAKKAEWADKVRSMSGWTMEEFGRPTKAWLKESEAEAEDAV